jgi:hypothetical protein
VHGTYKNKILILKSENSDNGKVSQLYMGFRKYQY